MKPVDVIMKMFPLSLVVFFFWIRQVFFACFFNLSPRDPVEWRTQFVVRLCFPSHLRKVPYLRWISNWMSILPRLNRNCCFKLKGIATRTISSSAIISPPVGPWKARIFHEIIVRVLTALKSCSIASLPAVIGPIIIREGISSIRQERMS